MWAVPGGFPGTYPVQPVQQWPLNIEAYKNIPHDEVDWATLAQQWIRMKESVPPMPPPVTQPMMEAPPAPRISSSFNNLPPSKNFYVKEKEAKHVEEGGEAPMDMDTKEEDVPNTSGVPGGSAWSQWNNWQPQWGWGWPTNTGTVPMTPAGPTGVDCKVKTQNIDSSFPVFNSYVAGVSNFPVVSNVTKVPPTAGPVDFSAGDGDSLPPRSQNFGIIPPCVNSKIPSKLTGKSGPLPVQSNSSNNDNSLLSLDALKRKQLPAWIRDGLSKMEKEKQRKLKEETETNTYSNQDTADDVYGMRPDSVLSNISSYDRQNMDASKDDGPTMAVEIASSTVTRRRSRFDDPGPRKGESTVSTETKKSIIKSQSEASSSSSPAPIRKTKDQLLTETMLSVRRILTEILLDVSKQQVQAIVKEEYLKTKSSGVILQHKKSQSLSLLGNSLGLTQYDSDSDSKSGSDEEDNSDEELKVEIEKKKNAFKRTEEEIEKEIEFQEELERRVIEKENETRDADETSEDEVNNSAEESEQDNKTGQLKKTEIIDEATPMNDGKLLIGHHSSCSFVKSGARSDEIESSSETEEGIDDVRKATIDNKTGSNGSSVQYGDIRFQPRSNVSDTSDTVVDHRGSVDDDDDDDYNSDIKKKNDEVPRAPPAPVISQIRKSAFRDGGDSVSKKNESVSSNVEIFKNQKSDVGHHDDESSSIEDESSSVEDESACSVDECSSSTGEPPFSSSKTTTSSRSSSSSSHRRCYKDEKRGKERKSAKKQKRVKEHERRGKKLSRRQSPLLDKGKRKERSRRSDEIDNDDYRAQRKDSNKVTKSSSKRTTNIEYASDDREKASERSRQRRKESSSPPAPVDVDRRKRKHSRSRSRRRSSGSGSRHRSREDRKHITSSTNRRGRSKGKEVSSPRKKKRKYDSSASSPSDVVDSRERRKMRTDRRTGSTSRSSTVVHAPTSSSSFRRYQHRPNSRSSSDDRNSASKSSSRSAATKSNKRR